MSAGAGRRRTRAPGATLAATLAGALAVAGATATAAPGATSSVTGDDGNPVPVGTPAPGVPTPVLRRMDVDAVVHREPGDGAIQVITLDPGGNTAGTQSGTYCWEYLSRVTDHVAYRGNGTYTVVARIFGRDAAGCSGPSVERRWTYELRSGVAIVPPAGPLRLGHPGSGGSRSFTIPIDPAPGALDYEVRYARDVRLAADGGIAGSSATASSRIAPSGFVLRPDGPGRYLVVGRAGRTQAYTPWSAPVTIDVVAPFALDGPLELPDGRGPSYRVRGRLEDPSATGRVAVLVRRPGRRRYARAGGSVGVRDGAFAHRLRLGRSGCYRLRFEYSGSRTVLAGSRTATVEVATQRSRRGPRVQVARVVG